eukprot:4116638-Amphidinium_carterae.2
MASATRVSEAAGAAMVSATGWMCFCRVSNAHSLILSAGQLTSGTSSGGIRSILHCCPTRVGACCLLLEPTFVKQR